ncbi:bifunctional hydroxymethylpyrimidine kinase/phosphomethylpyrimidine kinase [Neptunitalea lumnitzerae]|uniref:hydroxymethylpyrimidine kinase n=1 Tax=Neptunitalea lumnitzerae TaxID=2965509 RepID=A0ABQ5MHN3_9FLAO|nr:bifunctional hydroxymethylpyrimidine kinase/phosphomethylpyrimidine kinase [Neptunitalea sp. Y10]GLB48914.1 hydroxymethylpyrimidine/phosphomethylpyrimidine kinase [Neptunitalea sp. Y10]
MENIKQYHKVLTIAGSDSGGGAGIQADIKAISACGCYAASAITALTAQNTQGVQGIHAVPVSFLKDQLEAVFSDIAFDAVKIGMLHSSEVIQTVKEALAKYPVKNIVLDPVMIATSGDRLLREEAITTLKNELLPIATLITPNLPEASLLIGKEIEHQETLAEYATVLGKQYNTSVLLKAGHFEEDTLTDVLYSFTTDTIHTFKNNRIHTPNTHGTGCTLSAAIASFLAKGNSMEKAVEQGIKYLHEALVEGKDYTLGKGHGPVAHFYKFWD